MPFPYRAYLKDYKELCSVLCIDFVNDCFYVLPYAELEGGSQIEVKGLENLRKFSGEYDKNKTPIYEKDVLKVYEHCCGDHRHREYLGEAMVKDENWVGSDYDSGDSLFDVVYNYGCEVVGNLDESPTMIDLYYAEKELDRKYPIKKN
jgi:hypothetical protein